MQTFELHDRRYEAMVETHPKHTLGGTQVTFEMGDLRHVATVDTLDRTGRPNGLEFHRYVPLDEKSVAFSENWVGEDYATSLQSNRGAQRLMKTLGFLATVGVVAGSVFL